MDVGMWAITTAISVVTFAAGVATTWIWNKRNNEAADRRQELDHQHRLRLAREANQAATRQRFDEIVRPSVVTVLAATRVLRTAAQVRAPITEENISNLNAPIDLFDLYPETHELAEAVTELRRHAATYRVQVDGLNARHAEMKELARGALRPDLGRMIERLAEQVGIQSEAIIAEASRVTMAASRVVAVEAEPGTAGSGDEKP
jgi:hypothetical protein